jgi:drug/metabolite transporter (DMT)-like permease
VTATLLAATLWGTSFSVNDRGLAYVGPGWFVVLRFAVGGLVVAAVALVLRRLDLRLPRDPFIWALAAANATGFLLQYYGQTLTTPARTALFVNTSAFAVALVERYVLRKRLGWARVAAILAGCAGAVVLIVGEDPSRLRGGQLVGDLLELGAGLAWSVYFVLNDRAIATRDPVAVTAWTFLLSSLLALPVLLLDPQPLAWSAPGAAAVLYAGVVTTAAAYGLWTYGLRGIRPSASALLLLWEILVASLVSLAIKRETFGAVELVGAALLLCAVVAMGLIAAREPSVPDREHI